VCDGTFRVMDPIYFRALHVRQGDVQVTFLSADLFLLDDDFERMVRAELSDQALPPGTLWRGPSHLSTAPIFANHYVLQPTASLRHFGRERDYARAAAMAIAQAMADASPAEVAVGVDQAPGELAFNRRAYDREGRFTYVSLSQWRNAPDHLTYEPYDQQLGVVYFRRAGGKRPIALLNFGCHALSLIDHIGHISGDYCGLLCQSYDVDGVDALFIQGALGNVSPNRVDPHPAKHIADTLRTLADQIIESIEPSVGDMPLRTSQRTITLPFRPLPTRERALRDLESAMREGRPDNTGRLRVWLSERFADQPNYTMSIRALAIGSSCLICIPGEPLAHVALRLRAELGWEHLLVLASPCPEVGYLATRQVLREGANEAMHSTLVPDAEQLVIAAATEASRELEEPALATRADALRA